jgi:hypothetical protein
VHQIHDCRFGTGICRDKINHAKMGIIILLLTMPTFKHKIPQEKLTVITQLYAKVSNLLAVIFKC